jgi:hypothetical protein
MLAVSIAVLALAAAWVRLQKQPQVQPQPQPQQQALPATPSQATQMLVVKPLPTDEYTQLGYISNDHGTTLPLYGRPSLTSRERFQYYVMTNEMNPVRLVVTHNGQDCSTDQGCIEIMDGESLAIREFGGSMFRVKLYPRQIVRYDPRIA